MNGQSKSIMTDDTTCDVGDLILVNRFAMIDYELYVLKNVVVLGDSFYEHGDSFYKVVYSMYVVCLVTGRLVYGNVGILEIVMLDGCSTAIFDDRTNGFWLPFGATIADIEAARTKFTTLTTNEGWEHVIERCFT